MHRVTQPKLTLPSLKRAQALRFPLIVSALMLTLNLTLVGCTPPTEEPKKQSVTPTVSTVTTSTNHELLSIWLDLADAQQQTHLATQALQTSVDSLLNEPNEANLQQAKQDWVSSYTQFAPLRLLKYLAEKQPILLSQLTPLEQAIDSWPIQPGFIDYFPPYQQSGLVNDISIPMTAETLRKQQGITDSSEITLGFQSIAYLLWGTDGQRPVSDYQVPKDQNSIKKLTPKDQQLSSVDSPQARRRAYLKIALQLLHDDLKSLGTHIESDSNLRQRYAELMPSTQQLLWKESIEKHLTSLYTEWLFNAAQDDEHLRNPSQAGVELAWCASSNFLIKQVDSLKLPFQLDSIKSCSRLKTKSPSDLAKQLIELIPSKDQLLNQNIRTSN